MSGIPTLVFINAQTGKLISTEGRSIVMEDDQGRDFPWTPKPLSEIIAGNFEDKEGEQKTWEDLKESRCVIGIYFSAHWVRGCVSGLFACTLYVVVCSLCMCLCNFSKHF